jgi:DNA-binding response OmpR family regulator
METILVVDGDPLERNLIVRYLSDADYLVLEAANGAEAVWIADYFQGDIHLMIVEYPIGTDIAEEIARFRPGIQILLTSEHPGGQPAPVNFGILQKPLWPCVLIPKVRNILDGIR